MDGDGKETVGEASTRCGRFGEKGEEGGGGDMKWEADDRRGRPEGAQNASLSRPVCVGHGISEGRGKSVRGRQSRETTERAAHLLDARASVAASRGARTGTGTGAVDARHDGVRDRLERLAVVVILVLARLVRVLDKLDRLVDRRLERRPVVAGPLASELVVLECVAERVGVRLEPVAGRDPLGNGRVLGGVLCGWECACGGREGGSAWVKGGGWMHPRVERREGSMRTFSASATILSRSSFESRPLSLVMVILDVLPVVLSAAETLRMPLASTSKVTSTCGTPRGAGGMPASSNLRRKSREKRREGGGFSILSEGPHTERACARGGRRTCRAGCCPSCARARPQRPG